MNTGVVDFDYDVWIARYPEFATSVSSVLAGSYFTEATLYCDNTGWSVIWNADQRALLLGMLTAHIAFLNNPTTSTSAVGRINNATQGTVKVSSELKYPAGSAQWYAQSKYGIAYWEATAQFRVAQYIPSPQYVPDPWEGVVQDVWY